MGRLESPEITHTKLAVAPAVTCACPRGPTHTLVGTTPASPSSYSLPPELWGKGPCEGVAGERQLCEVGRELPAAGELPGELIGAQVQQLHGVGNGQDGRRNWAQGGMPRP